MATQEELDKAFEWAKAQVGKTYVLGAFGDAFDCSTYMSGIATMIRDGKAKRWFTTHPFHSGAFSPLPGWERDLEAPFMIGITADGIGHTGGTLLGTEFEATAAGNRVVRWGPGARGARDSMYDFVYGFRPSLLEGNVEYTTVTVSSFDTLASLAETYKTTVDELAQLNDLLPVGKQLVVTDPSVEVPPEEEEPIEHEVTTDETYQTIAALHKIGLDKLLELNSVKPSVGSKLTVGFKIPEPKPIDPYLNGLPTVNMANPSAKRLQMELKRVGYMADDVELADNYGPRTQEGVVRFHNENPQYRNANLTYDPQIGPAGWLYLRGMADGVADPKPITTLDTAGQIPVNSVQYIKHTGGSGRIVAENAVRAALDVMELPVTQEWITGYLTMALRESSYNPNAVNTYDINAKNVPEINGGKNAADGHPGQCSRGMWQCIPQTFARYHQAGTSLSIYDPVASAAASINYVRAVYGVANDGSNLAARVQQADPNRNPKGY